jgi:hypothetical protein
MIINNLKLVSRSKKNKHMKKTVLIILVTFFSTAIKAQNKILFEYDAAGNQVKRELCINCPASSGKAAKEIAVLQEEDLQVFNPQDTFSYYPNPVQEQLYLKWEKANQATLTSIHIFSLSGQVMKTLVNLENKNETTLAFQAYPQGVYSVLLVYSDGEEKSIKIIKQ